MMVTRLVIDSLLQFHWRLPVTTVVIGLAVIVLVVRRFQAWAQTAVRRQLWYLPLFIGGFEAVGVLSLAMQCSFGATPRQNTNNLLLTAGVVAIMVVVTLILGAIGQSMAGGQLRIAPPAGACGGR